jgi:hypothetical protein
MRIRIALLALACVQPLRAQVPTLTRVTQFGCADCEGALLFASVQALTVGKDGRITVVDKADPRVRVFNAQGALVASFGRTGSGPAELRLAMGVNARADGGADVIDMTGRRVVRLGARGEDLGAVAIRGWATGAATAPGGGQTVITISNPMDSVIQLQRVVGDSLRDLLRVGPGAFPGRTTGIELLSVAVAPDGSLALGDGLMAYRIRRYRGDGSFVSEIVRDVKKVRRTPEEIREITDRRSREMGKMAAMLKAEGRSSAPMPLPNVPAERNYFDIGALQFDELGRLWVRAERARAGGTVFDVFDNAGRYLGEVRLPVRMREYALGAGILAGVVTDEMDVQQIGVWRVGT